MCCFVVHQPSCCDGVSRYSAETNATLNHMYYGYLIVSMLGWAVFLLALWSKQIIGNKDAENETIAPGIQRNDWMGGMKNMPESQKLHCTLAVLSISLLCLY